MPRPKMPPEERALTTKYRFGDHSDDATGAHNEQSREWRRELAEADFPQGLRNELLAMIELGTPPVDAAEYLGISVQKVYGLAAINSEFRDALDNATAAACVCGGTPWLRVEGRRRCFCPAAREHRARESREYRQRCKGG